MGIVASGFVDSLRQLSALDALMGSAVKVPLLSPKVGATTVALTGSTTGEGAARPVSRIEIGPNTMTRMHSDVLLVLTEEVLRATPTAGQALISRELRSGLAAAQDDALLTLLATGAGSSAASTGASVAAALADIEAGIGNMALGTASCELSVGCPFGPVRGS